MGEASHAPPEEEIEIIFISDDEDNQDEEEIEVIVISDDEDSQDGPPVDEDSDAIIED